MNANFFSFLCIFQTRILKTRYQMNLRISCSLVFSLNPLIQPDMSFLVLCLFMTTLITGSSPKYEQICLIRSYLFVIITKDMVLLEKTMRKIYPLSEIIYKIHSTIMFCQTTKILK